jgi:hypothetical protein
VLVKLLHRNFEAALEKGRRFRIGCPRGQFMQNEKHKQGRKKYHHDARKDVRMGMTMPQAAGRITA